VELEDITDILKNKDKVVDSQVASKLMKLWQISAPFVGVGPCAWEKQLISRLLFRQETVGICDCCEFVGDYAAEAARAAIGNSNLAAARVFLQQCSTQRRDKGIIRLKEVAVAFEYNLKKISLTGMETMEDAELKSLRDSSDKMLLYLEKAKNQLNADESRIQVTVPACHQSSALKVTRDGIADTQLMTGVWKFACLRRVQASLEPYRSALRFDHVDIKAAYDSAVRGYSSDDKRGIAQVSLAYYCDQAIKALHTHDDNRLISFNQDFDSEWVEDYADIAINGYIKGLRLGSSFCRDRIPRLFDLLGEYSGGKGVEHWTTAIQKVPAWVFLNCSSHLCGCLNMREQAPFIAAALEKLATEYPNALIYQLSVLSRDKLRYCGAHTLSLLQSPAMNMFMESLDYLSHPELRWNDGLDVIEGLVSKGLLPAALDEYRHLLERIREGRHVGRQIGGYNVKMANKIEQIVSKEGGGPDECVTLFTDSDQVRAFLRKVKFNDIVAYAAGKASLLLFSEWLNAFNPAYRVEIPGQYLDEISRPPDTGTHVFIQYIHTQLVVQPSIRRPKKITFGGTNGRDYHFLVKGGEDLRIDERIQYIVRTLNKLTSTKSAAEVAIGISRVGPQARDQKLCVKTYHVIPVTPRLGILQWLDHTQNLQGIIEDEMLLDADFRRRNTDAIYHDNGADKVVIHALESTKLKESLIPSDLGVDAYHREIPRSETVSCYERMSQLQPCDFIKRKLCRDSKDAEVFFLMRNEYLRSLSACCVITYLLGIGDRSHSPNHLLTHSPNHLLTHSPNHLLTHSPKAPR
jgi:DNA-dependent protein kinase catalytic subunit